jgi:hypothetical protein
MIFERPFDELMQQVRRKEFMNVGTLEIICEWLPISQKHETENWLLLTH